MKTVAPAADWPESWRHVYGFDRVEVFGDRSNPGHTCAYRTRARHLLEMADSVLAPGGRVLDLAAAQGNYTLRLAERGYDVTWNDLRAELEGYVRLKHERGTVRFAPGNAFELRFDEPFDLVLITEIIEHVAHPDEFLERVAALTRPGAYVLLSTPNGAYFLADRPRFSETPDPRRYESVQFRPDASGHIFLLHEDELAPLAAAAGLEVCEVRLFTNALTNGHLKTAALHRILPGFVIDGIERATRTLPRPLARRLHTGMAALLRRRALSPSGRRASVRA
ncbi:MAG TPA: methyltransferase domain-containing protein [Gemmatimonadaceae bacterium]|nr:methyltransferase domain-containing protein [Gemmatimonadaceae bacterium]